MQSTNKFNRNQFLHLARKLRAEGNITIMREKLGGCTTLVARLNGSRDAVSLYMGALGHIDLGCNFTRAR